MFNYRMLANQHITLNPNSEAGLFEFKMWLLRGKFDENIIEKDEKG